CAPQHACSGARRSAFQNEVFAVEEIGGVAAVERERFESGEGNEFGGSRLPAIAEHAVHSESALALRKRIRRHGTPAGEIKITKLFRGLFRAPWVFPLATVRCAVRRALPLGFGGQ